jgi:phosphoserine phosphatase RsbU/P
LIGFALSLIYIFRDFLTTVLSYFVFHLLLVTSDGWLMEASPDIMIFYPAAGIIIIFLSFGFVAVTRGKSVKELPKYVPEYIEDLAQEERIKQELQIARKVQQSFLPVSKPDLEGLDLAATCIPAYETGGDYYDFIRLDDHRVAITVGDVSGKGFQAAFYMTFIKGVLHALCQEYESTVPILRKANRLFRQNARKGTFISLIFGVIDLKKNEFIFSRAGHNPLFYYREKENVIQTIKPNGLAIGMTDGELFESNISETKLALNRGDMLILFTDGIVEAVNDNGDQYGDHRLERMIYFHHSKSVGRDGRSHHS